MKNLNTIICGLTCLFCWACENSVSQREGLAEDNNIDDTLAITEMDQISPTAQPEMVPLSPESYNSDEFDQIGWELMATESFGGIKMDMDSTEVVTILGWPDSISQAIFWGADGGFHQDWIYSENGITIGMNKIPDHPDPKYHQAIVDRMFLYPPSEFSTNRRISIGSTIKEVRSNYRKAIADTTSHNNLVAGTVYGGLIFQFQNDTVVRIFLGAAAE